MKKIILYGHIGSGNIGNDSSFEAALYQVKKYQSDADVICVCNGPLEVTRRFGIPALSMSGVNADEQVASGLGARIKRLWSHLLHEVLFWIQQPRWFQPGDKFIVVGTGAVDDMGVRRPWHSPYELYKWCKVAKMGGAQVIFMSVGVGPIKNRFSKTFMLKALRRADYRSYRETAAFDYLQSLGFDTSGDLLYPDLVFSLPKAILPAYKKSSPDSKVVGLGLIDYYGWHYNKDTSGKLHEEYFSKIKCFVSWLLEEGFIIRIISGDRGDYVPIQQLVEYLENIGQTQWREKLIVQQISTVNELFNQIAQTDLVIASRFHNVLCTLMVERPVISLGYHEKNELLMKGMGLGEYCQYIESFTNERLMEQFNSCIKNTDQIISQIQDRLDHYRDLLDEQYKTILS
jgi:polysaccharide pyruvyl transferase WcaK-like protein